MKNRVINTTVLIFVMLVATSCKKFLDTKPTDFLAPVTYFNTKEQLEYGIAAVYDILQNGNLYGNNLLHMYALEADEGFHSRTSPASGPHIYDFTASNNYTTNYWSILYQGIGRANLLLENVNKNEAIDISIRNKIKGEALFLRGYFHFLLAQNFGGVPLILKTVTSPFDVEKPRATLKETYDQIVKDMTEAEGLVANIREIGYGGRISKSAVRGILARVYLNMAGYPLNETARYEDARFWAKKVMDDGAAAHNLNPSFANVFINYAQDKYDVNESIWEVEFRGNGGDAFAETGLVGYQNGSGSTNPLTGIALGVIRATADYYQKFGVGDLRRDWTIASFTYAATGESGTKNYITSTSRQQLYLRHSAKYRREFETVLPKSSSAGPINYALLRFSDVLLMFAEADNEINGPTQDAIEAVNKIRKRAWSTGIKAISITNGGTGYTTTSLPTITFSGGNGSQASAIAVVNGTTKKVTGITFVKDAVIGQLNGKDYTSAPTVTITGGAGTGATATAIIYTEDDYKLTALETSSPEAFRDLIRDERSRELGFESLRKSDLIRWGIFLQRMEEIRTVMTVEIATGQYFYTRPYVNVKEKNLLWPIPEKELALNPALEQNPDWK
jgi:hypothetical protein